MQESLRQNEQRERQMDEEHERYINEPFIDEDERNTGTEHNVNEETETPRPTLTNAFFLSALQTPDCVYMTDKPMEEVGKT